MLFFILGGLMLAPEVSLIHIIPNPKLDGAL